MKDNVLAFIKHFQNEGTIKTFTEGCCYWFAHILKERFSGLIYYNPVENHFATKIDGSLYDITGELVDGRNWMMWRKYIAMDLLDAIRVIKDCVNKD